MCLSLPRVCNRLMNLIRIPRSGTRGIFSTGPNHVQPAVSQTIGADGKMKFRVGSQMFIEEPLGLPAQDGFGWPQLEFNEAIGPNNRYIICRKLGWGTTSSVWLAHDTVNNSYVAIKILIGRLTDLFPQNCLPEQMILKQVSSLPNPHCLQLLSDFIIPGKGSAGKHLCFVTQVLGGDAIKLDETCGPIFPLPLAKCILLHTLHGIAHAHSCGIVHTDLHLSNIFFDAGMSTADLDKFLKSSPSYRHPPEESHDGMMQAAVSQPLPVPTLEEAMQRTFMLGDFGSAQPIATHITNEITVPDLRPPEIIIGSPWNEKVDIWTFGCLIFEVVTHRHFFKLDPLPELNLDPTTSQLRQMIAYTEEGFSPEQLTAGQWSAQFFKADCNLIAEIPIPIFPIERAIRCYHIIGEEEVVPMATLMRRCLHLDPANRASAAELLSDPWFEGVDPT